MNKSFDVFLSHNSKDKPAVCELAEALRARGLAVWFDEWELVPGRPWQEALEEVIETCQSSAVLVGKDGLGPWHAAEMRGCLTEFVHRKLPVIPVLLPGTAEVPKLPIFLKEFTWVDLREGLTEEGLDRLQWGVTGRRPDRSEPKPLNPEPVIAPAFPTHHVGQLIGPPKLATREPDFQGISGQPFDDPFTGIRFLWIPGGRFQMGENLGWSYWLSPGRTPVHWVRVSPFWLGETPVTNRQYENFLEHTGAEEPSEWNKPRFSSPDQPVVGVSWGEAVAFCRWLSKVSGRQVLLPTEAQWEFAARGTDSRIYPWGNEPPDDTRACFSLRMGERRQPTPVGSFPGGMGPFGTLDQAGNVWEWCQDAFDPKAYAKRRGKEPLDPVVGEKVVGTEGDRITRGGNWFDTEGYLRAAYRYWIRAGHRSFIFGFRVAAVPPRP